MEFKRQVAQEFLGGETLHGLAKRHGICPNLIRIWVQKYEGGDFDKDAAAADLLQQYEARIAALERLVGKQALELEFLKGAVIRAPRPKSANTSVVVGAGLRHRRRMPADGDRPLGRIRPRLRRPSQALDRRTHSCLAWSLPKNGQGPGVPQPQSARLPPPRFDPPHAAKTCNPTCSSRTDS
jgi:transposase